ncbi:MAG: hypothetical protein HN377_07440 [Alphaproteobacteria bacterium]|jgi:7-cyano-7-deazaguanine reductase|nr:hypothetical protein [Alphaproteobacteria bacterium]MBT7942023.1 hypothetical protein [Alphaproteobacteria bacterium]
MDTNERRALLQTAPNPDETLDYLSGLEGSILIFDKADPTVIAIRYIPDRQIVDPPAFGRYLVGLSGLPWQTLEELATTVLGDLSNQLVARWVRVAVTAPKMAYPGIGAHAVVVEDLQPGWNNPSLLLRLEALRD